MDGREIPGYYFDREKKKYFQIQKAHTALNPESKHVLQNIRHEKKQEKAQEHAAVRGAKRQKETIVRRYLRDSLTHARLDREVGSRRSSYYMKNLWPNACASRLPDSLPNIDALRRVKFSPLRYFDHDPATNTTYAVQGDNRIKRIRDDKHGVPPEDADTSDHETSIANHETPPWLRRDNDSTGELLAQLTSKISSLIYMPTSGALAATTWGSDRPPVVYLSDPERDGPFVHQLFTLNNTSSIQDAAARPNPRTSVSDGIAAADTENLAVAASSSLRLFTRSPTGAWDATTVLETNTDILTVDWMSPTVIVFGQRNGKIRLYDTRSNGSSHILTHPGPVGKVRRADDPTRIVASGIQDTLFLYDIRSPRSSGSMADSGNQHYNEQYFAARDTGYYHGKKRLKLMQGAFQWYAPRRTNLSELY